MQVQQDLLLQTSFYTCLNSNNNLSIRKLVLIWIKKIQREICNSFLRLVRTCNSRLATMPNISSLVREKGQVTLPDNVQSQIADVIRDEMSKDEDATDVIAVFDSPK